MFGYININKPEIKFKDFDTYRSFYCGFCQILKKKYGHLGQLTLSYDLTFLYLLFTALYEPETRIKSVRCKLHPFQKRPTHTNEHAEYAADMSVLLTYYKCLDDWKDEKKRSRLLFSKALKKRVQKAQTQYPKIAKAIEENLENLQKGEEKEGVDLDTMAGHFGRILAEIFSVYEDTWQPTLYKMGYFLGKYIYLLDAYEDVEEDEKKGRYNPFSKFYQSAEFDEEVENILTLMMAESAKAYEKLPIVEHLDILRNIMYSGVWVDFARIKGARKKDV